MNTLTLTCAFLMRARAQIALAPVFALVACRSAGEACLIRAGEPLINIASVRDSVSSAAIAVVVIRDAKFQGLALTDIAVLTDPSKAPVIQATVEGQQLRCTVVCGFAASSGTYQFEVGALGYASRIITVDASYANLGQGCPKLSTGGPRLSFTLSKL